MIFTISVFCWWKIPRKKSERKLFFSHVFSDDVFHIILDNVLLKDSVRIFRYFINFALSHATQKTIASLEHLALSYFALVFWSPSHESAFNYFWREIIISVAFNFKNYYSGLFYSIIILDYSILLERVSSFLKTISQTNNLAGSCWVPLFPELLLSALHSINL